MAKFVTLGPFPLGMNTLAASHDLPQGTCRLARNTVFADSGWIRRRSGATRIAALTAPHSLAHGYYVSASVLYRADSMQAFAPQLVKALSGNAAMAYAKTDQHVFASNGIDALRISGTTARAWCPPKPAAPTLTTGVGMLLSGTYRVAISYTDADGVEGPLSDVQQVSASGAIVVTHPAAPAGATHINTYASVTEGTALQFQGQQLASATSQTLTEIELGRAPIGLGKAVLPAGDVLAMHNGRLLSATGDTLAYSEPYQYGLTDPLKNWIRFRAPISVVLPVASGVFVCADETFFLAGADIAQGDVVTKLPYGATKGTAFATSTKAGNLYGWYGAHGVVVATDDGQVSALQEDHIAAQQAASGTLALVESNGVRAFLACLGGTPTPSPLVAADYEAEMEGLLDV